MEQTFNIHQAKTHLSRLIELVEAGEDVVLARAGKPVARLVPYRKRGQERQPGLWRGKVEILPGFDELDEEITRELEGDPAP